MSDSYSYWIIRVQGLGIIFLIFNPSISSEAALEYIICIFIIYKLLTYMDDRNNVVGKGEDSAGAGMLLLLNSIFALLLLPAFFISFL